MRWPKLEPKKIEGLNTPRPWCLNVPASISNNGKRQRLFFETKEQAESQIMSIRNRRMTFGETLEQLSPTRASEALAAYRLLEGHDVSLLDAVTGFLAVHKDRNSSIPFLELFNSFLDAKKDRNQQYLSELRITRDRWQELHTKLVCDVTHRDLEPLLYKLTPGPGTRSCGTGERSLTTASRKATFQRIQSAAWTSRDESGEKLKP
jgi:hypothetical protein